MSRLRAAPVTALSLVAVLVLGACQSGRARTTPAASRAAGSRSAFSLTSPAFADQGVIPKTFTCDGSGQSPPLAWSGVPAGAAELALTVEDPDAPNGTFVHWVLYGLTPSAGSLEAGSLEAGSPEGTPGVNGAGRRGYAGPCPPRGTEHRYVFVLSALGRSTRLPSGAGAGQLRAVSATAVLGQSRLVGRYGR